MRSVIKELILSPEFWSYAALPILMGLMFGLNGGIPGESKLRHVVAVFAVLVWTVSLTVAFTLVRPSIGVLALMLSVITSGVSYRIVGSLAESLDDALNCRRL